CLRSTCRRSRRSTWQSSPPCIGQKGQRQEKRPARRMAIPDPAYSLKRSPAPPTFCECCHGGLSRPSISVRRRAAFVGAERERPHPRRSYGCRVYLQDEADNSAIGRHVDCSTMLVRDVRFCKGGGANDYRRRLFHSHGT